MVFELAVPCILTRIQSYDWTFERRYVFFKYSSKFRRGPGAAFHFVNTCRHLISFCPVHPCLIFTAIPLTLSNDVIQDTMGLKICLHMQKTALSAKALPLYEDNRTPCCALVPPVSAAFLSYPDDLIHLILLVSTRPVMILLSKIPQMLLRLHCFLTFFPYLSLFPHCFSHDTNLSRS